MYYTKDTKEEGLEMPYTMIRSHHTHKNGVLLYETVFVKNIIVKLTINDITHDCRIIMLA